MGIVEIIHGKWIAVVPFGLDFHRDIDDIFDLEMVMACGSNIVGIYFISMT